MWVRSMEGQLQAPDSGSDVETQPGKKLTIQAIPRETVDLQLVHEQQPQVQPAWTESFNSEALRLLLATTFPNAQPSSWWLSGASTSSGPGQSFQISLTVVYTRKRGKQGRKASNPPLAQLRPSKPLVFKKTSKTKGKNLMLQDGSSSVTPDTLEGLRTSPRIRSLLDGHRKPV
jgi:hypothetical protein